MRYHLRIFLALIVFAVPTAFAQETAASLDTPPPVELTGTQVRSITSTIVEGQQYDLYINLPRSYADETTRTTYPVLFVLDAQWDFTKASAIYGDQFYDGDVPEMIIVGITWKDGQTAGGLRARDFTPTHVSQMSTSGGAPLFLAFLKDELIPFIEAEYPVRTDDRALMGSSFGGLFTLYAMFQETALFNRYIVSAPSLHWDNRVPYRLEETYAAQHTDLAARVFMVLGEREDVATFNHFAETLRRRGYENLDLQTHVVTKTGHAGHKPEGFARGLQFVFKRPALALSPAVLDAHVGTYQHNGQMHIQLRRDGSALIGEAPGQPALTLHAESERDFYIDGAHVFLHFKQENDHVVGFTLRTFDDERYFERVND